MNNNNLQHNNQPDLNRIVFNGLECEFTEQGEWLYKAVPFKSKPSLPEQPHYQVINELESKYSDLLEDRLSDALKDIVRYLNVS